MISFSAADIRHITAAQGYVELGMYEDANNELEAITPELWSHRDVLVVRLAMYSKMKRWEPVRNVAKILAKAEPTKPQ